MEKTAFFSRQIGNDGGGRLDSGSENLFGSPYPPFACFVPDATNGTHGTLSIVDTTSMDCNSIEEEKQLIVKLPVVVGGREKLLNALIDSGAQCDLIRLGLFSEFLEQPTQQMRFKMADGTLLRGGGKSIVLELAFQREIQDEFPKIWSANVEFYEAEIGCDCYISFPTLRRLKLMVIADEGILARKVGRDKIDRLQPVFSPRALNALEKKKTWQWKISQDVDMVQKLTKKAKIAEKSANFASTKGGVAGQRSFEKKIAMVEVESFGENCVFSHHIGNDGGGRLDSGSENLFGSPYPPFACLVPDDTNGTYGTLSILAATSMDCNSFDNNGSTTIVNGTTTVGGGCNSIVSIGNSTSASNGSIGIVENKTAFSIGTGMFGKPTHWGLRLSRTSNFMKVQRGAIPIDPKCSFPAPSEKKVLVFPHHQEKIAEKNAVRCALSKKPGFGEKDRYFVQHGAKNCDPHSQTGGGAVCTNVGPCVVQSKEKLPPVLDRIKFEAQTAKMRRDHQNCGAKTEKNAAFEAPKRGIVFGAENRKFLMREPVNFDAIARKKAEPYFWSPRGTIGQFGIPCVHICKEEPPPVLDRTNFGEERAKFVEDSRDFGDFSRKKGSQHVFGQPTGEKNGFC